MQGAHTARAQHDGKSTARRVQRAQLVHAQDGAVDVQVHAEVLDLHDAFLLRVVDLCLEVDEAYQVEVQDCHLREPRRHLELGVRRVLVDHGSEQASLAAIQRPGVPGRPTQRTLVRQWAKGVVTAQTWAEALTLDAH